MDVPGERLVTKYFPGTGHSYDRVVRWTTLGLDRRWKRRLLDALPPCRSVLDLACGTGILTFLLLERHPAARVVGVDITEDYLRVARAKHERRGGDVRFLLGDATTAPVQAEGPFDAVVSCYLPKYVDPDRLLDNVTPALRPGGVLAFHDFDRPRGFVPRLVWRAWFGILNTVTPLLHDEWKQVFDRSLTRLIVESHWRRLLHGALLRHGYVDVRLVPLTWRSATLVLARRP